MKPSILLIDDERSFRLIFEEALRAEGYEVRSAADLASGREAWNQNAPNLVIIDRNLPDGDGVTLLSELRAEAEERNLGTTFMVVTAYADVDNAVLALKHGADDYITKPVQLPDLLIKLRKALERRALERTVEALRRREVDVVTLLQRTQSPTMRTVLEMAERVAQSPDTPVLIQGESGSGKDLVARYIHARTRARNDGAMVELNCAAITEQLAESELFGHEKGAFTDAKVAKRGLLELADAGTLFLDEVADLGPSVQGKLLRVLETMRFRRVGGTRDREVDVRVIAATHRDLQAEVESQSFRLDLYHRLDVFHLEVPPLRERPEDIPLLAASFLDDIARRLGRGSMTLGTECVATLKSYPFPGNVRELKNVIERAVILERGSELSVESMLLKGGRSKQPTPEGFFSVELVDGQPPTLRDVDQAYVQRVVELAGGNKSKAAKWLGVSYPTLQKRLS